MKKIEAIVQPFKLESVVDTLADMGVDGMTVTDVMGHGRRPFARRPAPATRAMARSSCTAFPRRSAFGTGSGTKPPSKREFCSRCGKGTGRTQTCMPTIDCVHWNGRRNRLPHLAG